LKHNLLFFGELPDQIVHGISISNQINLSILSEKFNLIKISENSKMNEHAKFSFLKFFKFFIYLLKLIEIKLKYKKVKYLYASLSISRFGILKNIFIIILSKILFKNSIIVLHNYRGDLDVFISNSKLNNLLCNILFLFTDKIIFLSSSLIPKDLYHFSKKINVVSNCVLPDFVINDSKEKKYTNLLYISHYIKSKGIFDLLTALKILELKNISFNIRMFGQFVKKDDFLKIKSYNSNNIEINDFLKSNDKMFTINDSKCLILPSHNEGQPQIILEAMSIGTPIIATNVGDIPNMLGFNYPFLTPPNNPEKLSETIEKFLKLNNQELINLTNYLKIRFHTNYTFEIHRNLLLKTFV